MSGMSLGHWFVVAVDVVFLLLTVVSFFTNRKNRRDIADVVIFIVLLMLFNVAAITIR